MDSRTGTVFVRNSTLLDREVRSLHSVTLQARDSENQTGSTELEITVTDINDQYPVINRDSYQVFVKEGAKCAVEIKVKIFLICQKRFLDKEACIEIVLVGKTKPWQQRWLQS